MGITSTIRSVKLPTQGQVVQTYKDAKTAIKRIEVNSINVRFYPKNSPFFYETKGTLHHFTSIILGTIELPEKLGFIVQDDSITFNKATKEEWLEVRQDYPLSLAVNRQLTTALTEAIRQFPDVPGWYIPTSINQIPVKNIIVDFNKDTKNSETIDLRKAGAPQSMVDWIDSLPGEVHITPKFLYDIMDIKIIEGLLQGDEQKGGIVFFVMGGLVFSLITMAFMLYIGA